MTVPADMQWGVEDENGSFSGIVGDLQFEVNSIHELSKTVSVSKRFVYLFVVFMFIHLTFVFSAHFKNTAVGPHCTCV